MTVALGLGVVGGALLASLRGRGRSEQLAFYAFLALALDALGQVLAPFGWPAWPLLALLVAALAVAERLSLALAVAALVSALAVAGSLWGGALWPGAAAAFGYLALALAVNRALAGEKRRLDRTADELARLKYGIGQIDPEDPGKPSPTAPLRQLSDDQRRSRQLDRAQELDATLRELVSLARVATGAQAVLHFEVDRSREVAFLRAWSGPDTLIPDASAPLAGDPFAFVLDRGASFYATDYRRLLWSLPWYRSEVKVGSLLAVPVRTGGVVAGVLVVDSLEVQALAGNEPAVLEGFAALIADALVNARAFHSREDRAVELDAVYPVSRALVAQKDEASVRRLLMRCAKELASYDAAAIVLVNEARGLYRIENGEGWPLEFEGREVALTEITWAAWLVNSMEESQLLEDLRAAHERMPILVLDEDQPQVESLLAVPLRERDRNLGALILLGPRGTFSSAIGRVLQLVANQAAASLSTLQTLERSKELAIKDGLTGLYNRREFERQLAQAIARQDRQGGSFALLLLDIDHFKRLNDSHGHPAGDAALRATSETIRRVLREGDTAARHGGEEFAVILPATEEPGALQLAERLRVEIQGSRVVFEGAKLQATTSIGVALWPEQGKTADVLLASADRALYAAKEAGRNRVVAASSLPPLA